MSEPVEFSRHANHLQMAALAGALWGKLSVSVLRSVVARIWQHSWAAQVSS
jgi:hypothetical protein